MTRYLIAAATVIGALSFATPASASGCDLGCVKHHVCAIVHCDNPITIEDPDYCIYTTDGTICI